MRFQHLLLSASLLSYCHAQEHRNINLDRSRSEHAQRFRFDAGLGVGGVQYSYISNIDWNQVVTPGPNAYKPERKSVFPGLFVEAEYSPMEGLGIVGHLNTWRNRSHVESINGGYFANGSAETMLIGGRWYWSSGHRRVLWYSGAMAGTCHASLGGANGVRKFDKVDFAHQLTFIGFRPQRGCGTSIELGQGYKGFLSLSFCAAF